MEELKLSPIPPDGSHTASEEGDRLSLNSNSSDTIFTQFNVSYSRTSHAIKEIAIGTETHVTQLHAVPALSFVAGTDTPFQTTEGDDPNNIVNDGIGNGKHENKSPTTSSSSSKSSDKYQRAYQDHTTNKSPSKKDDVLASHHSHSSTSSMLSGDVSSHVINHVAAGISLQTQPVTVPPSLRPPPRLLDKPGHPNPRVFSSTNPDEVDFSSAAAASVAAVKEAMEFAQAKLKVAKELMEKKHDNLRKSKKLGYQKSIKDKEREVSQASAELEDFGGGLVRSEKRSEVPTPAKFYKEKEEDDVRNEEEGLARHDKAKT